MRRHGVARKIRHQAKVEGFSKRQVLREAAYALDSTTIDHLCLSLFP